MEPNRPVVATDRRPIDEARAWVESVSDMLEQERGVEYGAAPRGLHHRDVLVVPRRRRLVCPSRIGRHHERGENIEVAIDAIGAVEFRGPPRKSCGLPVYEHCADVGATRQVTLHPRDREILGVEGGPVFRTEDRPGLHVDQADLPLLSDPPRHPRPCENRERLATRRKSDPARMKEPEFSIRAARAEVPDAHVLKGKSAFVFQKEVTLFGKEQRKAREVHLLRIDFDLTEVGIRGEVECELRGDPPLQIESDRSFASFLNHCGPGDPIAQHVGLNPEISTRRQVSQAFQCARHRELVDAELKRHRCPHGVLVLPAKPPREVEPPRLWTLGRVEPKRGKRDGDFCNPARVGDRSANFGDAFPGRGDRPLVVERLSVEHRAGRVHREYEAVLLVVIGVQREAKDVRVRRIEVLLEPRHTQRADVRVVHDSSDIELVVIVENPDHRRLGRRHSGLWGDLNPRLGRRGRASPSGIVQPSVDVNSTLDLQCRHHGAWERQRIDRSPRGSTAYLCGQRRCDSE